MQITIYIHETSFLINNFALCRHAHCLSALQAWCHWISLWLTKNDCKNQADALINALVAAATDVLSPAYCSPTSSCPLDTSASVADDQSKEAVFRASLQLLSSIIGDIRSPYLWSSLTWIQLYDSVHNIRYLPPTVSNAPISLCFPCCSFFIRFSFF